MRRVKWRHNVTILVILVGVLLLFQILLGNHALEHDQPSTSRKDFAVSANNLPLQASPSEDVLKRRVQEEIEWTTTPPGMRKVDCSVPCFLKSKVGLNGKIFVSIGNKTKASLMHSMEGPLHYHRIKTKGDSDGLATTSFLSDIPLPYFSWAEYNIHTQPVDTEDPDVIPGASFAARNCKSLNERENLVKQLQKYIRVDSVSSCLHNADWPKGVSRSDKDGMMRRYLFHLAFENECSNDYATEKLYGSLASGTLPIYYGPPNARHFAPRDSIINVEDFESVDALGKYLQYLIQNHTAYKEYHSWRFRPLPLDFVKKFNFTHVHSECRACKWLYARERNLGWHHLNQDIVWSLGAARQEPVRYEDVHPGSAQVRDSLPFRHVMNRPVSTKKKKQRTRRQSTPKRREETTPDEESLEVEEEIQGGLSEDTDQVEESRLREEARKAAATFQPPPGMNRRECDVPCAVKPKTGILGALRVQSLNAKATFMHSMEGPQHYPQLRGRGNHDGLATTSFVSDIPLPYFSWAEYDIHTAPIDPDDPKVIAGASFAARNCKSLNDREGLVRKLQEYIRVDSLSTCLNNAPWPSDIKRSDKVGMMRRYMFHLAFENECSDDYATEKLFGSLSSGSLPVYYGPPNANSLAPEKSIVNVADFANWDALGKHLQYLIRNHTAYNEYHAWRHRPLSPAFVEKFNFTHTHSECRACRWLYAKQNNLGWVHRKQEIIWRRGATFEQPH